MYSSDLSPMEGANSTAERVALMQQAIDDQRDMLRRNIKKPIERLRVGEQGSGMEIPQVLCTYEEVLEAYLRTESARRCNTALE